MDKRTKAKELEKLAGGDEEDNKRSLGGVRGAMI
jgi:hypothetical protein